MSFQFILPQFFREILNVFRGKNAIINDMTDLYYVEDAYRLYNELDES